MSAVDPAKRLRAGEFTWWVNQEFLRPELRERLALPHALMTPPAEPIPRRDSLPRVTELVRTQLPELPERGLVIKRYRTRNWWQSLKDLARPSRARRAFHCAFVLKQLGVATPEPVAVGERRCCRWLQEAFLISEELS